MSGSDATLELSRRRLLEAAGMAVAVSLIGGGSAEAAPVIDRSSDLGTAAPMHGLHLQFGADASSEIVVSWHTMRPVRRPRVALGRLDGTFERNVAAAES